MRAMSSLVRPAAVSRRHSSSRRETAEALALPVRTAVTAANMAQHSRCELECLRLTAAGRTSEDIARILGLSVHTANQYLTSAGVKLDAVNRMHAVAKAMRAGLIE